MDGFVVVLLVLEGLVLVDVVVDVDALNAEDKYNCNIRKMAEIKNEEK